MFQAPPGNAPLAPEDGSLNSGFFALRKKERMAKIQFAI
jgi:hypothetical protein